MLYGPGEYPLVQKVREVAQVEFRTELLPDASDLHHSSVSRILADIYDVPEDAYRP